MNTNMNEESHEPKQPVEITAFDPIRKYFDDAWKILFSPREFFRSSRSQGGLIPILTFALVSHWLGRLFEYFWQSLTGSATWLHWKKLANSLNTSSDIDSIGRMPFFMQTKDLVVKWFWGASSVIVDPFFTTIRLLLVSVFIYGAARIFIRPTTTAPQQVVTYESILKIMCFATTSSLLLIIPYVGTPLAGIWLIVIATVGIQETYKVGTGRALVVALSPKLFIAAMILLFATVALAFAIKFIQMLAF